MIKKIYKQKHAKSKWFNRSLQTMKQEKRKAERKLKKYPTQENKNLYNTIKNKYNFQLKETRTKFFKSSILKCKQDNKTLYKTLSKLTGNVKEKNLSHN